jgi:hypothetical protein
MDALKQALSGALGIAPPPPPPAGPLPDPMASPWVAQLRVLRAQIPAQPSLGQLRQRSDALVKELKKAGRTRDASDLQKLREDFEKARDKAAWAEIKGLFERLELPDRAYRALKQAENLDAADLLGRLEKKGESLKGAGADRVRDTLLGKP